MIFLVGREDENNTPLSYKEIIERPINVELFMKYSSEFHKGLLPGNKEYPKGTEGDNGHMPTEFGWLSPDGKYLESPWGDHEKSAGQIVEKCGFEKQYRTWLDTQNKNFSSLGHQDNYRDFLLAEKGYCLIHNPSGDGGYHISRIRPYTGKQKDFLFKYFMNIGDTLRAESFLENETETTVL